MNLSPRQQEVLSHLAAGLSDAEIARELQISKWSVRTHLHFVRERLGESNRVRLARWVWEQKGAPT